MIKTQLLKEQINESNKDNDLAIKVTVEALKAIAVQLYKISCLLDEFIKAPEDYNRTRCYLAFIDQ